MGFEWQLICGFEQMYTFCLTIWLIMQRTYDERMKQMWPLKSLCHVYIIREAKFLDKIYRKIIELFKNKYTWNNIIFANKCILLSQQ